MATKAKDNKSGKRNPAARSTERSFPVDGFATASQAAEFLSVSSRTVYRMIEDSQIENLPLRNGEAVRIPWQALHALMAEAMSRKISK